MVVTLHSSSSDLVLATTVLQTVDRNITRGSELVETVGVAPTTNCLQGSLAATAHVSPNWHGVLVPPQPRRVLETQLRELAHAVALELERSAGVAPAPPRWQRGVLLLNHKRPENGGRNTMPPHAALDWLPCVPALITTKNEHLHTSLTLAWPRDFSVERFGVSGTPPMKPLALLLIGVGNVQLRQDSSAGKGRALDTFAPRRLTLYKVAPQWPSQESCCSDRSRRAAS